MNAIKANAMRALGAVLGGALLVCAAALGLVGCDRHPETVVDIAAASVTDQNDAFLDALSALGLRGRYPDDDLIAGAKEVCDQLAAGVDPMTIVSRTADRFPKMADNDGIGKFLGAAVTIYCAHLDKHMRWPR